MPREKKRVRSKANGEGSVYERKDGRWEAVLTYRTGAGFKRRRSYHYSRSEADRALTKMKSDRDGGIVLDVSIATLEEYLSVWLADSVAVSVDPKTLEGYEIACRVHIVPALGHVRLRDLRPQQIQSFHAAKHRQGLSVRTRQNIHGTLKRALKQAVAWGELSSSPAENLDPPKAPAEDAEDGSEEIRALADAEAIRLFDAARNANSRFRYLYIVAVRTGLRQGELLGLKWDDLNLDVDPAALTLRRSLAARKGGGFVFTPTKRKRQRRKLALHWEAADAFRDQRELQTEERQAAEGRWKEHGLVFPSVIGTPMSARNLYRRDFKPLLKRAELPDISFHDLRHSFATIMLFEWEVDARIVQEMMGHASIKLTMDTYSHVLPNTQADVIRRLRTLHSNPTTGRLPSDREEEGIPMRKNRAGHEG